MCYYILFTFYEMTRGSFDESTINWKEGGWRVYWRGGFNPTKTVSILLRDTNNVSDSMWVFQWVFNLFESLIYILSHSKCRSYNILKWRDLWKGLIDCWTWLMGTIVEGRKGQQMDRQDRQTNGQTHTYTSGLPICN